MNGTYFSPRLYLQDDTPPAASTAGGGGADVGGQKTVAAKMKEAAQQNEVEEEEEEEEGLVKPEDVRDVSGARRGSRSFFFYCASGVHGRFFAWFCVFVISCFSFFWGGELKEFM